MKNNLIILTAIFCVSSVSLCGASGSTGAEFLKVNVSARSGAMGGATLAAADSALQAQQVPTALSSLEKQEAAFGYFGRGLGVNFNQFAYARAFKKSKTSAALNVLYGSYGDIEETRVRLGNNQGFKTGGSFNASDYSIAATVFKSLMPSLSAGINLKFFHQNIADSSAQGFAFDASALYSATFGEQPVNFAFAFKNVGPRYSFESSDLDLPLTFSGGGATKLFSKTLLATADFEKEKGENLVVKNGLEYTLKEKFFLRIGQKDWSNAQENFAFGAGLHWKNLTLDYAIEPFDTLTPTHRVSLNAQF